MRVRLLSARSAARRAAVPEETILNWAALGMLAGQDTPDGVRYREDDLDALILATPPAAPRLAAPPAHVPPLTWVKPGQAARILGRSTETLRKYAGQGLLTRDLQGLYDLDSVRALRDQMENAQAD